MRITISYWRMPDVIWQRLRKLIPKWHPSRKGGRRPLDSRQVANGIYYVLRTGCPWKAAPSQFGSGSSLHRYFQSWVKRGVFRKLWKQGIVEYHRRRRIAWRWQTLDTAMNKAPLGGEKNREKPYGSWQTRRQAVGADRRTRGRAGTGHWAGQPA